MIPDEEILPVLRERAKAMITQLAREDSMQTMSAFVHFQWMPEISSQPLIEIRFVNIDKNGKRVIIRNFMNELVQAERRAIARIHRERK